MQGTRKCKVCGKEYSYCKTWVSSDIFRYQDVACSPECGAAYFKQVEAARAGSTVEDAADIKDAEIKTAKIVGRKKTKNDSSDDKNEPVTEK